MGALLSRCSSLQDQLIEALLDTLTPVQKDFGAFGVSLESADHDDDESVMLDWKNSASMASTCMGRCGRTSLILVIRSYRSTLGLVSPKSHRIVASASTLVTSILIPMTTPTSLKT